jgi:hypothetical protein
MNDIIISTNRKAVAYLNSKKSIDTVLTFKGNADENNRLTYRVLSVHFIAFRVNENAANDFQVPYPLIF